MAGYFFAVMITLAFLMIIFGEQDEDDLENRVESLERRMDNLMNDTQALKEWTRRNGNNFGENQRFDS